MLSRTTLTTAAVALVTVMGGCALLPDDDDEPTATSAGELADDSSHGYRCFPCDPSEVNDALLLEAEAFAQQILGYAVGISAECFDLGEHGSECLVGFATNDEGCPKILVDCVGALGPSRVHCSSLGCR